MNKDKIIKQLTEYRRAAYLQANIEAVSIGEHYDSLQPDRPHMLFHRLGDWFDRQIQRIRLGLEIESCPPAELRVSLSEFVARRICNVPIPAC